ncbi:MAG TPA: hypothetical protein PK878_05400 [bacterium]|nr:hypothetical protein [bacterium]HOL93160.1 hypothetical protein [bacterium]HPP00224.1 hypothetical protein [bacterium]
MRVFLFFTHFGLIYFLTMFVPLPSPAPVWVALHDWNEEWETRYARWISTSVDIDLLQPINLAVDCADLCYVVRAIFSRNSGLPFLASDANGVKIGHAMDTWNREPSAADWRKDRRFHAFLRELVRHVTTRSFPHDTYPVGLNQRTVQPGLVVYENLIASHASFIGRVDPSQIIPVVFFEASVPPSVRFKRSTTLDVYIYTPEVPRHHSGVVRWNWPVEKNGRWQLIPDEQMPLYSGEIYDPSFAFRTQLAKALNRVAKSAAHTTDIHHDEIIPELVHFFQQEIQFRARVVQQAEALLRQKGSGFRSESFDYTYNTDSRDNRLFNLMQQIWAGLYDYDIPRDRFFAALERIPIVLSSHWPPANLFYVFIAVDQRWISSDAYVSTEKRWGMRWDAVQQDWIFNGRLTSGEVAEWYRSAKDKGDVFDAAMRALYPEND